MLHELVPLLLLVQEEGGASAPAPFGGGFLFPLVLVFAIFYFLVMRPEKRNRLRHQQMLDSLEKGDKVITTGGMHATVVQLGEGSVTLQIADGVRVKFARQAIQGKLEEPAPVDEKSAAAVK